MSEATIVSFVQDGAHTAYRLTVPRGTSRARAGEIAEEWVTRNPVEAPHLVGAYVWREGDCAAHDAALAFACADAHGVAVHLTDLSWALAAYTPVGHG